MNKKVRKINFSADHFQNPSSLLLSPSYSVCRPAEWALKLDALVALAGKRVEERKKELYRKAGAGPQAQADVHRQICLWSLRLQLYCRMRENFQNTGQWLGQSVAFLEIHLGTQITGLFSFIPDFVEIHIFLPVPFKINLNKAEVLFCPTLLYEAPPSLLAGPQ